MKNKLFVVLIIVILILIANSTNSLGTLVEQFDKQIYIGDDSTSELKSKSGEIVGVIQIVGTAVSVGTMIFIGIKYVLGSAEEKASYKKSLLPYFVGAVLIFGATNLTQIIYNWAKDI